ncbi:UDP-N-acetylmuramoyl-tripeptide--D-alanyl-D-alanine ligase [Actinomycetospora soli]|uniref:UDP-N-acetylmuramoyl-tripeptide--D-alanyl-D- alanine ligase n=1 Tax=Actinomycetospora soli TaxID=2893887 RepID=UPI001E441894|nr:UDP-N-acetylmuramoyl-tripeptide--D-alanyl-D-alanine ligase [Actinomycetospora soli]MCD2190094.1 UDP-N-acetylmuramoyl-tripeptide--D-alanyl-D-alanine ligase [Actinomycetospora soli]
MIELTLAELARLVGGRLHRATGDERVTGTVEFDSRAVTPGGLFVALPGERVDGHAFATTAVAAGAAGVLAAREVDAPAVLVDPLPADAPVPDAALDAGGAAVLVALQTLARHAVDSLPDLDVVGLTGSSGKTSTKDLIAGLLEHDGPTVAPPGSFNNELGHPWTVLRADASTRHLVLELSARGRGHIAALCRVAPPRVGAVLNVGSAHLGEFGSREAIAQAKGELVEALPAAADGGVAVLGADDPVVAAMRSRTAARVVHAGRAPEADVRAVDEVIDDEGRPRFRLVTPAGEAEVALGLRGAHQVDNALVAAAIALETTGLDVGTVAEVLGAAVPRSRWRMEVGERPDGVRVLNDAYNANPESMRAALATLAAMGGRHTAVLGAMAELGADADAAHAELGRLAASSGLHRLVVVGEAAREVHEAARAAGLDSDLVPDAASAVEAVHPEPGDVVLVKASRSAGLETVARALLEAGAQR